MGVSALRTVTFLTQKLAALETWMALYPRSVWCGPASVCLQGQQWSKQFNGQQWSKAGARDCSSQQAGAAHDTAQCWAPLWAAGLPAGHAAMHCTSISTHSSSPRRGSRAALEADGHALNASILDGRQLQVDQAHPAHGSLDCREGGAGTGGRSHSTQTAWQAGGACNVPCAGWHQVEGCTDGLGLSCATQWEGGGPGGGGGGADVDATHWGRACPGPGQ